MAKTYQVEGYWDCPVCGAKGIRGCHRECPNCGKARGEGVRFYLEGEVNESQAIQNANTRPDWLCPFYSTYNDDSATSCASCGAPKSDTDYFDVQRERDFKKQEQHYHDHEPVSFSQPSTPPAKTYFDEEDDDQGSSQGSGYNEHIKIVAAALLVIALICAVCKMTASKPVDMEACNS